MAKIQRRWVVGNEYEVKGAGGVRWFKFLARIKVGRGEALIFRPLRKASKLRRKKATKKGGKKR